MSGIFNLFGSTNVTPRAQQQQRMGSSDMLNRQSLKTNIIGGGPLKQGSTPKPKGLSVRSKSDLNVCKPSPRTPTTLAKPKLSTLDNTLHPKTARQKETVEKLQIVREKQIRALSPVSKSPFFNLTIRQKGTEDLLFKKPVTPKATDRKKFIYPEPENLAPYVDEGFDIYDKGILNNDIDFIKNLLNSSKKPESIVPWNDEGFESDPEIITTPPMSPINNSDCPSPMSDMDLNAPAMPAFDDSDDDG